MFYKQLLVFICVVISFCLVQVSFAQEPGEEGVFILEEEIEEEFKTELLETEAKPRFITADVLTAKDVEPAVSYYIRSDIDRKFSGLIANLNLEKIYGVTQEYKAATVYFDYSYTSVRNLENILYEKGQMTFIKFNSGKWFNAELSIFLQDSYRSLIDSDSN